MHDVLDNLLPRPLWVDPTGEDFLIAPETTVTLTGRTSARAQFATRRLTAMIDEEFGLRLSVTVNQSHEDGFQICLGDTSTGERAGEASAAESAEGYDLVVRGGGIRLTSSTAEGLFWGVMTLRQLLYRAENQIHAAGVRIVDQPRYRWRGFMIDSGRSPNSPAKMKRIIRIASAFKLNFVVFREGDDELCAVRYRTNQLGSANPHALDIEQMRDLVEYADQYGITVVPEIESLGHSAAKKLHYPDLVCGGFEEKYTEKLRHVRKAHLAPGDDRSYALLESMYREWMGILTGSLIHIGMDEVRLGEEEQSRHLQGLLPRIDRVVVECGRQITPIVWGDAPPTPVSHADRVIRCLWGYPSHGAVNLANEFLVKQGLDRLSREGCREQAMMAGGSDSCHQPYSKSEDTEALRSLAAWAMWGNRYPNFIGLLAVQWSGNMLDDWLADFLAAGDWGWRPPEQTPSMEGELERIRANLARLRDAASPRPEEMDPPAWDGIWLNGREWGKDIMTGTSAI